MVRPDQSNHQSSLIGLRPFVSVARHAFVPKYSTTEEPCKRHVFLQLYAGDGRSKNTHGLMQIVTGTDHVIHVRFIVRIARELRKARGINNVLSELVPRQIGKTAHFHQTQILAVHIQRDERYVQLSASLEDGKVIVEGPAPSFVPFHTRFHLVRRYFFRDVGVQCRLELHLYHLQSHRHVIVAGILLRLTLFVNAADEVGLQ
mmetsp:Transcript_25859/g.55851  ORF Transcript_25859/g.55851 Transcript_25859/m.55851 type:complete len:203 (-) Transcript_25859:531-1139(-)